MTIAPAKLDQYCRPINADEAIQAHLRGRKGAKITRRFSFTISAIYDLGGAIGLLHWASARVQQCIGSPAEQIQLRVLLRTCREAQRRHNRALIKQWEEQQLIEQKASVERQQRNQELLNKRARERFMAPDPRQEIRQRLEQTLKLNPAPSSPMAVRKQNQSVSLIMNQQEAPKQFLRPPLARNEFDHAESSQEQPEPPQAAPVNDCETDDLSQKIDELITEIQTQPDQQIEHEANCESACCVAPVEISEPVAATGLAGSSEATQIQVRLSGVDCEGKPTDLAELIKALRP